MRDRTALLALTMACLLAFAGCEDSSATGDAATSHEAVSSPSPSRLPEIPRLPDDFPLDAGWPERVRGPVRTSLALPGCEDGSGAPPNPNGTDRLVSTWYRDAGGERQLTTYDDSAQATTVAHRLVAYYRRCPVAVSHELPWRTVTSVRPAGIGEEAWVVVRDLAINGRPSGAEVALIVRFGRAVLVDVGGLHYRVGPRHAPLSTQLHRSVDGQTDRALGVLEAWGALEGTSP